MNRVRKKRGLHHIGNVDLDKELELLGRIHSNKLTDGQRRFVAFAIGAQRLPYPTRLMAVSYLPSNDKPPEVQIEIRAAELAAVGILGTDIYPLELTGWNAHVLGHVGWHSESPHWQAGWLAREIIINRSNDE